MTQHTLKNNLASPTALLLNLLLSISLFMVCRLLFYLVNQSYFPGLTLEMLPNILRGGFLFDLSALIYTNALYILLMAFPLHYKENRRYQLATKIVFILINSVCILCNLMDTVYFRFTNKRTTASVFSEFSGESNLLSIVGTELIHYWYLTLAGMFLIYLLFKLYKKPWARVGAFHPIPYYTVQILVLTAVIPCAIFGIRGGIGPTVRPIAISNANQYVQRPIEATVVLNTPFSIIRTIGKKVYVNPEYFSTEESLAKVFTPVHSPCADSTFRPLNVVVLIMESLGREYIGTLNKDLEGGTYQGYTPFVDSLLSKSLTFEHTFANGRQSIDGMPSILSSIPRFMDPYFLTHYAMNKVSGIAGALRTKGYHTSFFHGAPNGSMGFEAFARASGYETYFGMDEYGNKHDFDGTWSIWDEEFFQFYADKLNTFEQPFASTLFSASSHHPYVVPEHYATIYPEEALLIHKCIRYTDHALQLFFEKAQTMPWFKNTLFVITADHTNQSNYPKYKNECGSYAVPIIFYHPGSELKGRMQTIAQQIDIMPTVLGYLHYDRPYVAFGRDLLNTPPESGYAVNHNNQIYQYFKNGYLLQFDGTQTMAVYDFVHDKLLKENLSGKVAEQASMETELKAIIQQYIERMVSDRLTVE